MAQLKQETSQLDTQRGSSGFKLTIHPSYTFVGSEPLDLATYDVSGLKDVLSECKRLKELSGATKVYQLNGILTPIIRNCP